MLYTYDGNKSGLVLQSLRQSLQELEEYYLNFKAPKLIRRTPHPRFFPGCTSFVNSEGRLITFKYLRCLGSVNSPSQAVFVVGTKDMKPRNLVVKFVERYGDASHRLLAKHGFAPTLHYLGSLDGKTPSDEYKNWMKFGLYLGPLRMAVMDYVPGRVMSDVLYRDECPAEMEEQLNRALNILHDEDYVFGDLRAPNVIFTPEGKVKLIDFCWAGRHGEARYPRLMSKSAGFPKDAKPLGVIEKAHDQEMLQNLVL